MAARLSAAAAAPPTAPQMRGPRHSRLTLPL